MSRRPTVVVLASIVVLVVTAGAVAAGLSVTIGLKGGLGSRTIKACGVTHHYTVYRVGSQITIAGAVQPAPASFRVKLKGKKCVHGAFATIWTAGAHERPNGTYQGVYPARRRGMYFLRAYAHIGSREFRSDKRYILVR